MGIQIAASLPAGSISAYAGAVEPNGWMFCYGQAISRATYAALFAAIGTAFGAGDGATTFNVPDLRGRVPFGKDNMGGTAANRLTAGGAGVPGATLGAAGGGETVTLTTAQMPSHTHGTTVGGALGGSYFAAGNPASNTLQTNSAGTGGAHANIPPGQVVNYIIKT